MWHPCLFLGDECAARNQEWLQGACIKLVINMASNISDYPLPPGVEYRKFPMHDGALAKVDHFYTEMEPLLLEYLGRGDNVLVHCQHGRSRSASMVLMYAMKHHGRTLKQAYHELMDVRNPGAPQDAVKGQLAMAEQRISRERKTPPSGVWDLSIYIR
jgi:protein-tyrosine phosphatase